MDLDGDKIDDAVLGLLWLTLHDGDRAWKGHDWDAMDRLHKKGMILNPVGKAKSGVLTDEGLAAAERLCVKLFGKAALPPQEQARQAALQSARPPRPRVRRLSEGE